VKWLRKAAAARNVRLIYGVNKREEFIYDDHFENLQSRCKKFEYIKVVASDNNWQGRKGLVTYAMKDMDLRGYKVYMCGPRPMVNAGLKVLKDAGVNEEDIFCESA
jgi:NAD(P)H-flavin reductase